MTTDADGKKYCIDINVKSNTVCTASKDKFLSNEKNKSQLIKLLAVLFRRNGIHVGRNGIHVEVAERADTSVASAAIKRVYNDDVVRAEDTDILCLLVHHYDAAEHRKLYFSTHKGGFFSS